MDDLFRETGEASERNEAARTRASVQALKWMVIQNTVILLVVTALFWETRSVWCFLLLFLMLFPKARKGKS